MLGSSANPSTPGQSITLTATVNGAAPSGQVVFYESGAFLGAADLNAGVATVAVSSLTVGSHALTATYYGDPNNDLSVGALTQTVAVAATPPPVVTVKPPKVRLAVGDQGFGRRQGAAELAQQACRRRDGLG